MKPTNWRLMGVAAAGFSFWLTSPQHARSQSATQESLAPCPGSAPEPTQSTTWSVAFCNRTGHDVVLEFHDNDCPAKDWSHRGDVYQRMVRKGESKTFPLCYANEPVGAKPAPGVPVVRLPGGKGVVTTWSVVGDCGERSKPLNLDARSFYDRGEYKSGIILLQYPPGASHCVVDGSSGAAGNTRGGAPGPPGGAPGPPGGAPGPPGGAPGPPGGASGPSGGASGPSGGAPGPSGDASGPSGATVAEPPSAADPSNAVGPSNRSEPAGPGSGASATAAASMAAAGSSAAAAAPRSPMIAPPTPTAAVRNRGAGAPAISAAIDTKDMVGRTVRVFAKDGAGYKCSVNLELTFTDGGSWNDHANIDITAGDADAPITTRRYLKSISKVQVTSSKCAPP